MAAPLTRFSTLIVCCFGLVLFIAYMINPVFANPTDPHQAHGHTKHDAPAVDNRIEVDFPKPIKLAMLERMRRNLSDIQKIQAALAKSDFKTAHQVAEFSLGVSSLGPHNARQAPFMPQEMQQLGIEMHRASSRVALAAEEGDTLKALEELARVTGLCVNCHAVYRAK